MKKVPEDLATKLYRSGDQFLAQGDDVRIDQVAEDLGIARATLYYYFSGKDDLISFLMQEKMERIAIQVQKAKAGEGTALERFEAAMRAAIYELASNPALCLNLMLATGRMEAMAEILTASERAIMAPLRELLIEARAVGDADIADIDLTISSLMGGTNMAVLQRWALTGEVDPDDMSQHAVTLFLNGVRAR
ncbi:MAG: TetR/AcrR family transcriptional regulator [Actinomycetia bacterium]|nr:TetR/AcrR family transcriptional regulator [Actinomycetes bacterium]MCP5031971.1 TetR/AcrR family transcriptional regulator [Actinomycetes bacterium]